jgi:AraC family transcriptional activator of pobA
MVLFIQNEEAMSSRMPSPPSVQAPEKSGKTLEFRRKRSGEAIPAFALYGEVATPGQEVLHIEEVQSRSRLYHWEIEPHVHQGLYQVLWVGHGAAEVVQDERRETVLGPAAIVVPPGVVHGFRFAPDTDGLVLTLSARFLVEGEFQSVGEAFRALFSAPGVLRFEPGDPSAARLGALFAELAAEFAQPGAADAPVAGWLARAVVWRLAQASAQRQQTVEAGARAHRHQALFTRFTVLVEQHFLAHWPVARYASLLGLSVPRLNRVVQAEAGRNALELLHERLTREACRRLVYIAAPVAHLAAELGFDDPAYFCRFFKRRMGVSPHQFRQQNTA